MSVKSKPATWRHRVGSKSSLTPAVAMDSRLEPSAVRAGRALVSSRRIRGFIQPEHSPNRELAQPGHGGPRPVWHRPGRTDMLQRASSAFKAIASGLAIGVVTIGTAAVVLSAQSATGTAVPIAAAVASTSATPAVGSAAPSTGLTAPAGKEQQGRPLNRMCRKLEGIDKRAHTFVARANAGATTKGSIAWLRAQAAAAKAKGDSAAADRLSRRAERRTETAAKLTALSTDLARVHQAHC